MATRVAVDALGGDHAPGEILAGAVAAASETIAPVLFGRADLDPHGLELIACGDLIAMHEKPAEAVRAKPDSTLARAVRAVGAGAARRCSSMPARTRTPGPSISCSSPTWGRSSLRRCSTSATRLCGCFRSARSPRRATS